jgi:hypothetical protein
MLCRDPARRLTAEQVLRHSWLTAMPAAQATHEPLAAEQPLRVRAGLGTLFKAHRDVGCGYTQRPTAVEAARIRAAADNTASAITAGGAAPAAVQLAPISTSSLLLQRRKKPM